MLNNDAVFGRWSTAVTLATRTVCVAILCWSVAAKDTRAEVVPIRSTVVTGGIAYVDPPDQTTPTDNDSQSQLTTLSPLSSSSLAVSDATYTDVRSWAGGNASWTDAAHGQVSLLHGWSQTNHLAEGSGGNGANVSWLYVCEGADAPATITVDYTTALNATDPFGSNDFVISFIAAERNGPASYAIASHTAAGSGSWTYEAPTLLYPYDPNWAYGLMISGGGSRVGGITPTTVERTGTFTWSIQEVPEPGTLALLCLFCLILGCGRHVWRSRPTRGPEVVR